MEIIGLACLIVLVLAIVVLPASIMIVAQGISENITKPTRAERKAQKKNK